jgi:quercetin dioxygenase-like cupin family protein
VTDLLIEIDLSGELAALRSTDAYRSASHAATTIAKQPGIRVVLIALKPGGRMHEHHAGAAITVQGFDGHVTFTVGDRNVALTSGVLITVAAGLSHSVVSADERAFILTIGELHAPS